MRGDARRLVKKFPALEVLFDESSKLGEEGLDTDVQNQLHHIIDTDEGNDVDIFWWMASHD